MPRFVVFGTSNLTIHCIVEAKSEGEAMEMAKELQPEESIPNEVICDPPEDFVWNEVYLESEIFGPKLVLGEKDD